MNKIWIYALGISLCLSACVKPEEEPTNEQQRQAKIEKYLQRAKTAGELDAQRTQALSVPVLVDVEHVNNEGQAVKIDFLTKAFKKNREFLQKYLEKNYKAHSTEEVMELLDQYKQQIRQATQEAVSPWDLGAKITSLKKNHDEKMPQFISEQTAMPRVVPDEELQGQTHEYLSRRCDEWVERIEFYYGMDTASACQPVLDQAVSDYIQALGSPINDQELDQEIDKIVQKAQQQIDETLHSSDDPLGTTPPALQSSLRTEMIVAHQQLEQTIERLYGKEAVLQAREVFTNVRGEVEKILQTNMHLTQKKAALEQLNAEYKRQILALQANWNAAISLPEPVLEDTPKENTEIEK